MTYFTLQNGPQTTIKVKICVLDIATTQTHCFEINSLNCRHNHGHYDRFIYSYISGILTISVHVIITSTYNLLGEVGYHSYGDQRNVSHQIRESFTSLQVQTYVCKHGRSYGLYRHCHQSRCNEQDCHGDGSTICRSQTYGEGISYRIAYLFFALTSWVSTASRT